jgi:nicotinamide mononucleotide transporter
MTWTAVAAYFAAHGLEWAGVLFTIFGIWLTTQRKLICWPVTLIAIFIYMVVFFRARLLSDALLQVFFAVFTFYGWWHWWRGVREEGEVRVVPLPLLSLAIAIVLGVPGGFLLGTVAKHLHAALPYLDAVLMSYSLVATWWQARKHIANWWLWIVVDLAYIGEYIYKNLWPTALLYAGLVGLAVLGLHNWRRAAAVQLAA